MNDRDLPAWLLRAKPPRKPWSMSERKVPAWMQEPTTPRKTATISHGRSKESNHGPSRDRGLELVRELLELLLAGLTIL